MVKGGESDRNSFRHVGMVQEDHGKPIYGVQFCTFYESGNELFATAGDNRLSVYKCEESSAGARPIRLLWGAQDNNSKEIYYAVAWGELDMQQSKEKQIIVAVAGLLGVIRILTVMGYPLGFVRGHGGPVNEMIFHTVFPHILFSASKDHTIRIWDCMLQTCLARLGGVSGHRDEVLTLDLIFPTSITGGRYGHLVTGSLDHMVCVWDLDKALDPVNTASFTSGLSIHPVASTLDLHADYVDSVRYLPILGAIASRAGGENHRIIIWRYHPSKETTSVVPKCSIEVLEQLEYKKAALWWLKFGTDCYGHILAAGTQDGRICVWRTANRFVNTADGLVVLPPSDDNPKVMKKSYPALKRRSVPVAPITALSSGDEETSSNSSAVDDAAQPSIVENSGAHKTNTPVTIPSVMVRFCDDLKHPRCTTAIRQVVLSRDGDRLIAVSDDARIWRWDRYDGHSAVATAKLPVVEEQEVISTPERKSARPNSSTPGRQQVATASPSVSNTPKKRPAATS